MINTWVQPGLRQAMQAFASHREKTTYFPELRMRIGVEHGFRSPAIARSFVDHSPDISPFAFELHMTPQGWSGRRRLTLEFDALNQGQY
jgi:hypothetical protein